MEKMNHYGQAAKLSRPHRQAMNTHARRCSFMIVSLEHKYVTGIVDTHFQFPGGL